MATEKLTSKNFEQEVAHATQPVVVDFWASWCGPCQLLGPILEEVAETVPDIKVMKCNVDEEMPLALQFGIDSIPALLKFENGQEKARSIGLISKEKVEAFLRT